jgi:phosphatidylglycerophosphate synthase
MPGRRLLILIPCALSSSRIVIGAAFPWLPVEWRLAALAIGGFTDLIDGYISRRLGVDGVFGQMLDPIADKILFACVILTLLVDGTLAWWEMLLAGTRDILVLVACLVVLVQGGWSTWQCMKARLPGKVTTALQIAFLLTLIAGYALAARVLLVATAVMGVAATMDYVLAYRREPAHRPDS